MYTSADDYADNSATTGSLSEDSQITGNIEIPHDADWFKVNLKIGTTYVFELNPSISDGTLPRPYLTLYDSSNYHFSLKSVSNGGLNNNPLFSYTPMLSGDYYLGVSAITSYGTEIGTYTLKATVVGTHQNNQPTGEVTLIYWTLEQANTVIADITKIADLDGLGTLNPFGSSFQWLRNGTVISGANKLSYVLTAADVGKSISVRVNYTDGFDTPESVTSKETGLVTASQSAPTGEVTISGADKTLSVSNTLADNDGLGVISYQWLLDGQVISGATKNTYSYSATDVDNNKAITVIATYTDGSGKTENVSSDNYYIYLQNTTLNVTNDSSVSYQWIRNEKPISGANHNTYILTQDDVGQNVAMTASRNGTTVIGSKLIVINVNDVPTGSVSITGSATQGQVLTASNSLADLDGLGQISFQWLSNGSPIKNANQAVYQVTELDAGKNLSVLATYTDGFGKLESMLSNAVTISEIPIVNNPPTGSINIIGDAVIDGVLSLTNTIKDADGLGNFSYLWESDSNILESDNASLKITNYELGQQIWATISYTDGAGNYEEVKSPLTKIVKAQVIKKSTTPTVKNDLLTGSTNGDVINGLAGNDTITGGLGADKLTGGKGADIFKYTSLKDSGITATTRDTITDFKPSEKDKIDLSALDANEKSTGDQAFTFIGNAAFSKTNAAGQLRFDTTSKILYGSTDADITPEFSIQLNGVKSLVTGDFIL